MTSKYWPQIGRNLPRRLGNGRGRFSENLSIYWAVNWLPAFPLFCCLLMTIKTTDLIWIISMMTLISLGVSFTVCLSMLKAWTNSTFWFDYFPTTQELLKLHSALFSCFLLMLFIYLFSTLAFKMTFKNWCLFGNASGKCWIYETVGSLFYYYDLWWLMF